MKSVPAGMQEDLDSGVTKHCYCWKLTRTDGVVMGFTNHDKDLTFDSVTYIAETGLSPTSMQQTTGLNVDSMDILGVLNAASLSENDLAAGIYDNAEVIAYLVDWTFTSDHVIMLAGSIGEISRGTIGFTAEIRGLAHALNQTTGDLYEPTCRADLGDDKCKVDLTGTSPEGYEYTILSSVTGLSSNVLFLADQAILSTVPSGWFNRGKITWTSGANTGLSMELKTHTQDGDLNVFLMWEPMPYDIAVSDTFRVVVGCDKSPDHCLARFSNMINFRGFNLIPGNDVVLRAVVSNEDNSGGSIF